LTKEKKKTKGKEEPKWSETTSKKESLPDQFFDYLLMNPISDLTRKLTNKYGIKIKI